MTDEKEDSTTEEEYTLKESELVGQLYPVLVDKYGNVIDGNQRLKANPDWQIVVLHHVDTEEKLLVSQGISNWQRKNLRFDEKNNSFHYRFNN